MRSITIRLNDHEVQLLEVAMAKNNFATYEEAVRGAVHVFLIHEADENIIDVDTPRVALSPAILREAIVETLGEGDAKPLDFDALIADLNIKVKVA